jgi:hypothetical protein
MKMCQRSATYAGWYSDHIAKIALAPKSEADAVPKVCGISLFEWASFIDQIKATGAGIAQISPITKIHLMEVCRGKQN